MGQIKVTKLDLKNINYQYFSPSIILSNSTHIYYHSQSQIEYPNKISSNILNKKRQKKLQLFKINQNNFIHDQNQHHLLETNEKILLERVNEGLNLSDHVIGLQNINNGFLYFGQFISNRIQQKITTQISQITNVQPNFQLILKKCIFTFNLKRSTHSIMIHLPAIPNKLSSYFLKYLKKTKQSHNRQISQFKKISIYLKKKIIQKQNSKKMTNIYDIQHTMITYAQTFPQYKQPSLSFQHFTDGSIFLQMVSTCTNIQIPYENFIVNCQKWTFKLNNLKKLVTLIENYFNTEIKKVIKTNDINLTQIAKNQSPHELGKLFQLVVAALTQAPNKQDHINTIMSLDQRSQSTFVSIIQNILETRILTSTQPHQPRQLESIEHLLSQNTHLKTELQLLLTQNRQLNKQLELLKHKLIDYEDQLNKIRDQEIDKKHLLQTDPKDKQYLRNMIENLKEKLMTTVRDNQLKVSALRQQIITLQSKSLKYQQLQQQLQQYKKKYSQTIQSYGKSKLWQREKIKLMRTINQKQQTIKKLNNKLDDANEQNYVMQERQVYAKMEMEKRDVRFKQLEKQVKKVHGGIYTSGLVQNPTISKSVTNTNITEQLVDIDRQQMQQLKSQLQRLKKKNRDSEREINKLKRNLQKNSSIENDKKKLERLILDVNNQNREQIQVLLATTYDFFVENQKLKEILKAQKVGV